MWRLLPVCLLVACAVNDAGNRGADDSETADSRIIQQTVLPLAPVTAADNPGQAVSRFATQGIRGWRDETGAWHLRQEVSHNRLRCATYETGLQLGKGSPDCTDVEWLTAVEYVSRLRHCNSATRLHEGSTSFADTSGRLAGASCARVVVRCTGAC